MTRPRADDPTHCRLCTVRLSPDDPPEAREHRLCRDCAQRPEGRRILVELPLTGRPNPDPGPDPPTGAGQATRSFTEPERSLIRAMYGYASARELLRILNERRQAETGDPDERYTLNDLEAEIARLRANAGEPEDWVSLRRLLAQARRAGVLTALTPTVMQDFAVIFQLTPAQLTHVADVIRQAQETPT